MTERRRGTTTLVRRPIPWWVWLLIGLLVALVVLVLLWPLLTGNDRAGTGATASPAGDTASPAGDTASPAGETASPAGETPAGSPVVGDVLLIIDAPDPASLVGSRVELTDVEVQSVVGDTTFWVGPSQDRQVLVVLEEDESAGPVEGQVDVEEGQTVSLTGVVREMPSTDEAMQRWQLSDDAAQALEGEDVFIRAQRVDIQQ